MNETQDIAFKSIDEIQQFQLTALIDTLEYVQNNSKYYHKIFQDKSIDISKITCLNDLQKLPVTTKKDLQIYNKEFLCVSPEKIIDYVTTSGTLGEPVTFGLTEKDLQRLAYNEKLSFETAGMTSHDVMQLMTTIDRRFMAGLAYFLGARALGCGIIRVGNGIPQLQWDTINRVEPSVAMVVPSFLLRLIDYAEKNNIDYRNSSLKKAICIGESLRNPDLSLNTLGKQIHEKWPELALHSTYASTEMQSSFTECSSQNGGHLPPDLIIVEFLDDNNQPVENGELGEVTITTLGVEGMPLVRFKTGDVCYHYSEPCSCGRNSIRLSPLVGRKGQMIKYKGTTLYPPAIYDILETIDAIETYIVEVYTNKIGTDSIIVRIGSRNQSVAFLKEIKDIFRSKIRVAPQIVFEPIELIEKLKHPEMSRKVVKFIDLREIKTS